MVLSLRSLRKSISLSTLLLGTALGTFLSNSSASASEYITLHYGIFGETVPMSELDELSNTGEATGALKDILNLAKEDPNEARDILNEEVKFDAYSLYQLLRTKPGEFVLSELAKVIHIKGYVAGVPALRSALVQSVLDDGKMTLLEVFQNYPTETMYVNAYQLVKDIKTFNGLFSEVKNVVNNLQCNCAVAQETTNSTQLISASENTQNCADLKVAAESQ